MDEGEHLDAAFILLLDEYFDGFVIEVVFFKHQFLEVALQSKVEIT